MNALLASAQKTTLCLVLALSNPGYAVEHDASTTPIKPLIGPVQAPQTASQSATSLPVDAELLIKQAVGEASAENRRLEEDLAIKIDRAKPSTLPPILAAVIALLAAIISPSITLHLAKRKEQVDISFADAAARLTIKKAVIDWRLEQIKLLYGPLDALLGQSGQLTSQLREILLNRNSKEFRWVDNPNAPARRDFQILIEGGWEPFRLVSHMSEVYDVSVDTSFLIDEIISTGDQIAAVVRTAAGYALAEPPSFRANMGQYLAHFSVLKRVRDAVRDKKTSVPNPVQSAWFPREFPGQASEGHKLISSWIEDWERSVAVAPEQTSSPVVQKLQGRV